METFSAVKLYSRIASKRLNCADVSVLLTSSCFYEKHTLLDTFRKFLKAPKKDNVTITVENWNICPQN